MIYCDKKGVSHRYNSGFDQYLNDPKSTDSFNLSKEESVLYEDIFYLSLGYFFYNRSRNKNTFKKKVNKFLTGTYVCNSGSEYQDFKTCLSSPYLRTYLYRVYDFRGYSVHHSNMKVHYNFDKNFFYKERINESKISKILSYITYNAGIGKHYADFNSDSIYYTQGTQHPKLSDEYLDYIYNCAKTIWLMSFSQLNFYKNQPITKKHKGFFYKEADGKTLQEEYAVVYDELKRTSKYVLNSVKNSKIQKFELADFL